MAPAMPWQLPCRALVRAVVCHDHLWPTICTNSALIVGTSDFSPRQKENPMLGTILLIVLILLLLGALPAWPYSRNWGYGPGGGLGLILVIVIILVLLGRI